jgi:hypothetical protein
MLTIQSKGLGRYRIEDQSTGFVLNFLNPSGLTYHLEKVMKLKKTQVQQVFTSLNTDGKVKMEMVKKVG